MKTKTFAAWMREEHAKVEELTDLLRKQTAVVPRVCTPQWVKETRGRFEHFRAHMHKHIALEEENGYMSQVLEIRPGLSGRVERLAQEHRDVIRLLGDLHTLATELSPGRHLLVREFCNRVRSLLSYTEHHESEENDLVEFVFTEDIGTKD